MDLCKGVPRYRLVRNSRAVFHVESDPPIHIPERFHEPFDGSGDQTGRKQARPGHGTDKGTAEDGMIDELGMECQQRQRHLCPFRKPYHMSLALMSTDLDQFRR